MVVSILLKLLFVLGWLCKTRLFTAPSGSEGGVFTVSLVWNPALTLVSPPSVIKTTVFLILTVSFGFMRTEL